MSDLHDGDGPEGLKGVVSGRGGGWSWLGRQALTIGGLLALVGIAGCRVHDFPDYPANYREFAYVSNGASNTLSVLDVVNVRVDREIQVGQNPVYVEVNPKRNEVYVVNAGGHDAGGRDARGTISVVDAEHNAVSATIQVGRQPRFISVSADGRLAYVANSGANSVSIVDLDLRREIAVIGTGESPVEARISPDGNTLVVPNRAGNSVSLVDPKGWRVRSVIEGCPGASDAAILPDSSKAFVACSGGHQIMAIALAHAADGANADRTNGRRHDALEALLDVGRGPVQLALKPDGGELFVSNSESDSISEVITGTNDVGGAYLMGSHPVQGLVSADNSLLYVSNFGSQDISVYAIDDGRREGSIQVGDGTSAMAFSATGHLLFGVDARSGNVAVMRTSSRSMFTLLSTGRGPNSIAIKAFRIP